MENASASERDAKLVVRLFLVRHGETVSNLEGRVSGQAESPLTELGKKQAFALGKSGRIDPYRFKLYSSDLQRTQETAKQILLGAQSTIGEGEEAEKSSGDFKNDSILGYFHFDQRLRELSKGARQGFPKTMSNEEAISARKQAKELQGQEFKDEEDIPKLESEQDGYNRFSQWLLEVVRDNIREYKSSQQNGENYTAKEPSLYLTLVVSHSALLRSVLVNMFSKRELIALGAVFDTPTHLVIPNTSLTVVDIVPNLENELWQSQEDPSPCTNVDDKLWKAEMVDLAWTGHYELIS